MRARRPRVVIVGAGFGGLATARGLARAQAEVLLFDRNNYHTFLPLLYQIAAAELGPADIAYPVRSILRRQRDARFHMDEVTGLDLERRVVRTPDHEIEYDALVLAVGSVTHHFGVPGSGEHSAPLKSLQEGVALRNHILLCFERAVHEPDPESRRRILTFAILGGGPTGVEFAGALAELVRGPIARDYPELDMGEVRVVVLEATDGLLPGLPERGRAYALNRLRGMGVEVRLALPVTSVAPGAVTLQDGSTLATETVIWTAGVRGDPAAQAWGLPAGRGGRVPVLPTLQVAGHPEVYVVGDLALLEHEGRPLPMIAPVAIQEGSWAARNIMRQSAGQPPLPFRYRDPGTMVTIGRNAAVAVLKGRCYTGFAAWVLWLSVHLVHLIGFRNRLVVLINWAWDYLFFERAVRLILPGQGGRRPAAS